MWLYFNSEGALVESGLQHGPAAKAGTTNYQIFAYFDGVDLITNNFATIKLIKPDFENSSYPLLAMRRVNMEYKKMGYENSEYFTENGGPNNDGVYPGFIFDFANFNGDQNVAILLDTPGLWKAIISLYSINNVISVQGTSTFNVQFGNVNNRGTEISIDELMSSYASALAAKLNIVDGIVVVNTIEDETATTFYNEGQIIYRKDNKTFYKVISGGHLNKYQLNSIVITSNFGTLDPNNGVLDVVKNNDDAIICLYDNDETPNWTFYRKWDQQGTSIVFTSGLKHNSVLNSLYENKINIDTSTGAYSLTTETINISADVDTSKLVKRIPYSDVSGISNLGVLKTLVGLTGNGVAVVELIEGENYLVSFADKMVGSGGGIGGPSLLRLYTDIVIESLFSSKRWNGLFLVADLQDVSLLDFMSTSSDNFYYQPYALNSTVTSKEAKSNKVTSISSSSTDTQYPSAKCVYDELATKQDTLVSGTNIKTINGASVLGSGDLTVSGGGAIPTYTAGSGINIDSNNEISVVGKQDTLVSGTSIKTINDTSLLGSGNISCVKVATSASASTAYVGTSGQRLYLIIPPSGSTSQISWSGLTQPITLTGINYMYIKSASTGSNGTISIYNAAGTLIESATKLSPSTTISQYGAIIIQVGSY